MRTRKKACFPAAGAALLAAALLAPHANAQLPGAQADERRTPGEPVFHLPPQPQPLASGAPFSRPIVATARAGEGLATFDATRLSVTSPQGERFSVGSYRDRPAPDAPPSAVAWSATMTLSVDAAAQWTSATMQLPAELVPVSGGMRCGDLIAPGPTGQYVDLVRGIAVFAATVPPGAGQGFAEGLDLATGIAWGRYGGDAGYVTAPFTVSPDGRHAIWPAINAAAPVLPVSGLYSYTRVGHTQPTDQLGNAGALDVATLQANFTAMTVSTALQLTMPGSQVWRADASNVPIAAGGTFQAVGTHGAGALNIAAPIPGATAGIVKGAFTGNALAGTAGAMLGYALNAGGPTGTTVSGVVGFRKP